MNLVATLDHLYLAKQGERGQRQVILSSLPLSLYIYLFISNSLLIYIYIFGSRSAFQLGLRL